MTVVAYDPYVKAVEGVKMVKLDELLAQADYISLHLPKTKESANMIGKINLPDEKRRASDQLCARRASLMRTPCMMRWLAARSRRALDVYAEEPPTDWKLVKTAECDLLAPYRRGDEGSAGPRWRGSGGEADRVAKK